MPTARRPAKPRRDRLHFGTAWPGGAGEAKGKPGPEPSVTGGWRLRPNGGR
jgi:hypothetical protein